MFIILIFYYTLEVKKPFGEKEIELTSAVRLSSYGLAAEKVYIHDPEVQINIENLVNRIQFCVEGNISAYVCNDRKSDRYRGALFENTKYHSRK